MKLSHLCILVTLLLVVGGVLGARNDLFGTTPHDWELKEIIVWGFYTQESEEEVREVEDYLRAMGDLEEGDSVRERFSHLRLGEERYGRSGQKFCRYATDEETKRKDPVINPDLRVRLYDREGHILSEDILTDQAPQNTKRSFPQNTEETAYHWQVIAYVPYNEKGHSLRLVRLENGKEILLERLEFHIAQSLYREIEEGKSYAYLITDDDCFLSPPT